MGSVVYKYRLVISREPQLLRIRKSEKIVHVAMQNAALNIWAVIDDSRVRVGDRYFCVVGTGHKWPEGAEYTGTALDGQFVWHVLEVRKPGTLETVAAQNTTVRVVDGAMKDIKR